MNRKLKAALIAVAVGLPLSAGGAAAYEKHADFEIFNEHLIELGGVEIGDSREQALYEHGTPLHVGNVVGGEMVLVDERSEKEKLNAYRVWSWAEEDGTYRTIEFEPSTNKVSWIHCSNLNPSAYVRCSTVGGVSTKLDLSISMFNNESSIVSSLGEPDEISFDEDDGVKRKVTRYNEMGLTLIFAEGQLLAIEKEAANPGFLWWLRNGPRL